MRGDGLPGHTILEHYRLERVLGQGGFGITYLATDLKLGRSVAVKEFFPSGATRQGTHVKPPATMNTAEFSAWLERFLEEARVLARFNHPGIVRVLEIFEGNGTAYLVMEALEGETLGSRLTRLGKLPEAEVTEIVLRLCDALEIVHKAGLLHRDIKPDNIFLTSDGRVVLIDFGSARMFVSSQRVRHTQIVTPEYAAPEQYASEAKFGAYTDIYGLSAVAYHALTGTLPPSAADQFAGVAKPLNLNAFENGLSEAVHKGLEAQVTLRPQSISHFRGIIKSAGAISFSSALVWDDVISNPKIAPSISLTNRKVLFENSAVLITEQFIKSKMTYYGFDQTHFKDLSHIFYEAKSLGSTGSYLSPIAIGISATTFVFFCGLAAFFNYGTFVVAGVFLSAITAFRLQSPLPEQFEYCLVLRDRKGLDWRPLRLSDETQMYELVQQLKRLHTDDYGRVL
jgi:serine/threonine protein kinase